MMDPCRSEGCDRPVSIKKHGVCRTCYEKLRRQGVVGHIPRCSVADCEKLVQARGLCSMHYWRTRNRGELGDAERFRRPPIERFNERYTAEPDGCWTWTGTVTPGGYGLFGASGKNKYAHRFAYEHHVGPIPEGLEIDHLCGNPSCVNPDHLEPVTPRENTLRSRGVSAKLAQRTVCDKCGGELTPVAGPRRRKCKTCMSRQLREYRERKRAKRQAG